MTKLTIHVKPTESALNGITLYEQIDMNQLNAFKNTDHAKRAYDENQQRSKHYADERHHLAKYAENYKRKSGLVAVTYTRGKSRLGRVYPVKSCGMTCFRRLTRNTLMKDTYYDIDMANAHPTILWGVLANSLPEGKQMELEYPRLTEYCEHRRKLIADVAHAYNCTERRAKDAFISLMYSGTVASWKKGDGSSEEPALVGTDPAIEGFLDAFGAEIQAIISLFVDANKDLYEKERDVYRKKPENAGKRNERGSFFALVMQDYELKIIEHLLTHIMTARKELTVTPEGHILTYTYDGFMLLKERVDAHDGIRALLDDMEQITFDEFGVDVKFTAKDMSNEYHTDFEYSPSTSCSDAKEDKKTMEAKAQSNLMEAFQKMKAEFERENFKVVHNSCFVQETFDEGSNRKLIQRCPTELSVAFSHLQVKWTGWHKDEPVEKSKPFIPMWTNCEDIRRYDRMDCYPDAAKCPPNCFNLWTPFEMERYACSPVVATDDVARGVAFLRNHLAIMCNHEPDTLLEFERWIAQMIQFPEVKTHMPIFQSEEGSGKGSFAQLMGKILGASKVTLTANPEEHVWGRFNHLMETSFLVFFDEISKQMTSGGIDKIKNLVTEPTMHIQHKGKGAYAIKSFHRFAGLTNAWDGGMTINKGSRRFLMCKMSDEKKGDDGYWGEFYALLDDVDVLRGFYTHYKTMEVPRVLPAPAMTAFARELQKLSVDVPTLWVRDLVADAARNKSTYLLNNRKQYKILNDGEYVIELTGKQACDALLEWCKDNGYPKYETNPVKLGVLLTLKRWAGFTEGRSKNTGKTRYYRVETLLRELATTE